MTQRVSRKDFMLKALKNGEDIIHLKKVVDIFNELDEFLDITINFERTKIINFNLEIPRQVNVSFRINTILKTTITKNAA